MHELAITQSAVDLAAQQAHEHGASRVVSVTMVIGSLTGVVEDSVRFYFDLIAKDTIVEGAAICFRTVLAQARCRECGAGFAPEDSLWRCPSCGGVQADITAGRELFLESIEVDGDTGTTEHTGG
jgi:hydrogenase nickel incorporation protein HypA/HybF